MMRQIENGDRLIARQDCGDDFQWTVGQQQFYAAKDLQPPKRCTDCARARRIRFRESVKRFGSA